MISNEKPKKILLVSNFLSHHFGTKSISELLGAKLEAEGWELITTSRYLSPIRRLGDMLWTTWRKRHDYHLATIDVYSGKAFIWAELTGILLRLLDKPYILNLQGGNLPAFTQRYPKRVHRLLSKASVVVTTSHMLQEKLSYVRDDIQYVPNPIEVKRYPFRLRAKPTPNICWLRAFHEIYNPTSAVKALALLKEEFEDATLTMIGPDKGDGTLQTVEDLSEQLGVSDSLQLVGAVPKAEVPQWLNKGDIFLNTTRYESFGVSVMEAAAVGLPIVTTNVGELPYLWEHDANALLVSPKDPKAIADAIRRILTEPDLAARLSQGAHQKAVKFDWSEILPRWESLLETSLES